MEAVEPILFEGHEEEGEGQVLRTALALSLITQRPFRLESVRVDRRSLGFRPQHLACVRAAEAISDSRSEGATLGGPALTFWPGPVRPGSYLIELGNTGSCPAVFQCLLYPLALAGESELTLLGGTHLPGSPSYHYLARVFLRAVGAYGLSPSLKLRAAGFAPEGGGDLRAFIPPVGAASVGQLPALARGTLKDVEVISMVAGQPFEVAERQAHAAELALRDSGIQASIENLPIPGQRSHGAVVLICAEFEHSVAGFTAFGERGKRPEGVGAEAASLLSRFMASAGAIDEHLADQLLIPAALLASGRLPHEATPSRFTTGHVTEHLTTNARTIERFLPVRIDVEPEGIVTVAPAGARP